MSPALHIFNLPADYFKLPFSDRTKDKSAANKPELILNFSLLFLFTAFSHHFNVLSEYGFDKLLILLSFSLPVYYLVAPKFRIPFLILIFCVFLVYAIGPVSAGFYTVTGLLFIFILRNPKTYWLIGILLILVTSIALLRLEILYFPRLIVGAHFVAAAFMFRGIWFYYESKHGLLKSGFWLDLAYFFIPANLCFTFFAIIDPLKFSNSYKGFEVFTSGLKRIAYGFSLVLLYRFTSNMFPVSFEDVNSFSTLVLYAISKYALVLNIAGIILSGAATLNLFGFELSTLFGNFLLATSFSELWRKINTNWSDFLLRVFYYPLYFKFKNKGPFIRVYISINIAFFLTWFLHDYQLFWISGIFPAKYTSIIYWMVFGNLVAYTAYNEFKNNPTIKRKLLPKSIVASCIFLLCSLLWLFWESESISEFIFLLRSAVVSSGFSLIDLAITVIGLISVYLVLFFLETVYKRHAEKTEKLLQTILLPGLFSILTISTLPFFETSFPQLSQKLSLLSGITISEEDNFARDESYYENVLSLSKNKTNPWEIHLKGEKSWGSSKGATRRTGDLLMREFVPNTVTNMGYFTLRINSGGFRDDEYPLVKDTNCFRIAIIGSSNECGYGVDKEYVFETLVEKHLDSVYRLKGRKIEILNFASLGSMLIQNIEITKRKVVQYKPDVLIYFSHPKEDKHIARNLSKLILNGVDLKYNILKETKISAGVTQNHSRQQIVKRLLPYSRSIMEWGYRELANLCAENGIKPVWAFIPTPKDDLPRLNYQKFSEMAVKRGFVVLDLSTVYEGYDIKKIRASETDLHPGILGHRLITDVFLQKFLEKNEALGLEK